MVERTSLLTNARLSVVIPVYNEEATVAEIVARVRAVPVALEIIAVDDASADGTPQILEGLHQDGARVGHRLGHGHELRPMRDQHPSPPAAGVGAVARLQANLDGTFGDVVAEAHDPKPGTFRT